MIKEQELLLMQRISVDVASDNTLLLAADHADQSQDITAGKNVSHLHNDSSLLIIEQDEYSLGENSFIS